MLPDFTSFPLPSNTTASLLTASIFSIVVLGSHTTFIPLVVKKGDTNGDGVVTSADYVRIKNYLRGTVKLDENQKFAADPTGDGTVTSSDYVRIKNYLRSKASITL